MVFVVIMVMVGMSFLLMVLKLHLVEILVLVKKKPSLLVLLLLLPLAPLVLQVQVLLLLLPLAPLVLQVQVLLLLLLLINQVTVPISQQIAGSFLRLVLVQLSPFLNQHPLLLRHPLLFLLTKLLPLILLTKLLPLILLTRLRLSSLLTNLQLLFLLILPLTPVGTKVILVKRKLIAVLNLSRNAPTKRNARNKILYSFHFLFGASLSLTICCVIFNTILILFIIYILTTV